MRGAVWLTLLHSDPLRTAASPAARLASNSRGALTVPLLVMLLTSTIFGLGTLGLMRHWRELTELQLRLDSCVGQTALDLRRMQSAIESSNRRIRALRAAQATASLAGQPPGSLTPLLEIEVAKQELELLHWRFRQAQWLFKRGCDGDQDLPLPLPSLSWHRDLPDMLGPQTLKWLPGTSPVLRLQLTHLPRAAAASVVQTTGGWTGGNSWKASWTIPATVPTAFGAGPVWAITR